jgi:penicillin amidase
MTRARRLWVLFLVAPLLLVLCAGCYVYWLARRAEPIYAGEITLPGLESVVTVRFARHAIPHAHARSREDLFFAQGYLVASERMWQMDLMRRVARGRLSEVLGEEALPIDRLFRTIGLERVAERNLATMSGTGRRYLEAYGRGVNAYRSETASRLPLEYHLARFRPAPWTALDSLAIAEYMAFLLSFNAKEEIVFLRLVRRLGSERTRELFPVDEGIPAPEPAPGLAAYTGPLGDPLAAYTKLAAERGLPLPSAASNSWALTGSRTRNGLPLLANDPHLAASAPSIWYELALEAPGYHAVGTSLPGLPLILIGHNEHLAWGFTASLADTQDIFVERATVDGLAVERAGGKSEPIRTRIERIAVRGREHPARMRIRCTDNGVILNDVLAERRPLPRDFIELRSSHLLALRSNLELPDGALDGLYGLNTAETVEQARAALELFVHASLNVLIAHRDGTIAWQLTGALPIRRRGLGTFPVTAWSGDYEWVGRVPFAQNPAALDPPTGVLVAANHRMVPRNSPVHVSSSWMAPYRALRIKEMLGKAEGLAAGDLLVMQMDRVSVEARRWLAALDRIEPRLRVTDPQAWAIARDQLLGWDGEFTPQSRPAALLVLLRSALFVELYGDELGEDLPALMSIAIMSYNALQETVRSGQSSFWDDLRTPALEEPAQIWGRALRRAWAELGGRGDEAPPRLDDLQRLVFPHAFHRLPLLGRLFDIGPFGVGGDAYTVNVMKAEAATPMKPIFVPTYRHVFTPGNWEQTGGTQTLGQSGHRFSPYRSDQLTDWLEGRLHPWTWGGPPPGEVIGTVRLLPAAPRHDAMLGSGN